MSISPSSPSEPEVLRARKRTWLSRLWVRIALVLLLIGVISLATWWWPRRTMVAVWRAGGTVTCERDRERAIKLLNWFDPTGGIWGRYFSTVYRVLSWASTDAEITGLNLTDTPVGTAWLAHTKRFPKLKSIGLHDRQLGPGLDHLGDHERLNSLDVTAVSQDRLTELKRLPQIKIVSLWKAEADKIDLNALAALPKLNALFVGNCPHTSSLLQRLPTLPRVETFVLQDCDGFTDDDLSHLARLPKLKYLDIVKSSPVSDAGLEYLSRLENLETLCLRKSSGQITKAGLQPLQRLPKLKQLIVLRGDLTLDQLDTLQQLLPNCTVLVH